MANWVYISNLAVKMRLANKGIMLRVEDDKGRLRGYLQITKAYIRWFRGREQTPRYQNHLDTFIAEAEA